MKRGLKVCLVSLIFVIFLVALIIVLAFTVFKPKDPEISVKVMSFPISSGLSGNATVNMTVTIVNRHYGSFRYENSMGHVNFKDLDVADVPMEPRIVPARSTVSFNTSTNFMIGKLVKDPKFWEEVTQNNGTVVLKSETILPGKATMLKIFKRDATVYNNCDISIHIAPMSVDSVCYSKLKL